MGKKKKKSSKNKERNSYVILIVVICACILAMIIALVVKNNSGGTSSTNQTSSEDSGTVATATSATQTLENEQVYGSVNDMVMDKDTKEVTLNIENSADNAYNLKVTVELDSGEVLYESDFISPGEVLAKVTFDTDITEGEYTVIVSVDSYSSDDGELVNGVIYTRTLTVE